MDNYERVETEINLFERFNEFDSKFDRSEVTNLTVEKRQI